MLSKKAKYALKALVYLGTHDKRSPILIAEVATEERIPVKFLEAILRELKNAGILHSQKGRGGGYRLGRAAERISVGRVVRIMDGPLAPLPCVSETAYRRCEECDDENTCGIRVVMKRVRDETARILDGTTLRDLLPGGRGAPEGGPASSATTPRRSSRNIGRRSTQ
jgi:Rrf2 family protein